LQLWFGFFIGFMVFRCPFQQYFSYIVAVSFIGGGSRRTLRKPPTCRKSLTNSITYNILYKLVLYSWN
jgi:hypothetical protein